MMSPSFRLVLAAAFGATVIVACSSSETSSPTSSGGTGGDASTEPDGTSGDPDAATPAEDSATVAPFTLTSTALAEGATFPVDNTCTGMDVSPPLAWGPGPAGTKSYAVVLNDTTIKFLHAVIYDIPASVTSLPANVEAAYAPKTPAGAHQTKSYLGTFGYSGPCPGTLHVYEFVLYALDVETLPGMTQSSSLADANTAIKAHMLASTRLTGKYKKP
jgi:Raf kinase inhibitor-like YbhB/YbcL family protein